MAHHSARKTNSSLAHIRPEKMNRLALQNPPRQTEKRQCPVFSCLPVNGRQEKRRTLNAPDGATACA
ncbi:MAG: hypothetical protein ACFNZS_06370 [Ottowia sp.]